jgi:alpha-tubulin suppressor-like RCC1 family protein
VFTYGSGENGRLGHGNTKTLVTPQFVALEHQRETIKGDRVVSCHCGVDFTVLLTGARSENRAIKTGLNLLQ